MFANACHDLGVIENISAGLRFDIIVVSEGKGGIAIRGSIRRES
jgi:hypothetical protein